MAVMADTKSCHLKTASLAGPKDPKAWPCKSSTSIASARASKGSDVIFSELAEILPCFHVRFYESAETTSSTKANSKMGRKGAEKGAHVPWKWRLLHSSWPQMKHCETSTSSRATLIRGSSVAFPCLKNFQLPTESPHGTRSICSKPGEKGVAQHNTGIDSLTV